VLAIVGLAAIDDLAIEAVFRRCASGPTMKRGGSDKTARDEPVFRPNSSSEGHGVFVLFDLDKQPLDDRFLHSTIGVMRLQGLQSIVAEG
jgi:hypothetical protein